MIAWFNSWWLRVPEPREFSVLFTVAYLVAFTTGVVTLAFPPVTLAQEVGKAGMASVGVLLCVGSVIAAIGGAFEFWHLERVGILACVGGLAIYWLIVLGLHTTTAGSRLTQLGVITLGILCLLVRWLMIRHYTFRPRG